MKYLGLCFVAIGSVRTVEAGSCASAGQDYPFVVGKEYSIRAGYAESRGLVKLRFDGSVYHLRLPLVFYGASHFAFFNQKGNRSLNGIKSPYREEFFADSIGDFETNSVLRKSILRVCKEIEAVFNRSQGRIRLEIEPQFITGNLIDLLGPRNIEELHYTELERLVRKMLDRKRIPFQLVFINPFPNQSFIQPGEWDLSADPSLLAHEVGHLLGIDDEGYEVKDYPLDGLMTDEVRLKYFRLVHAKARTRLYPFDENSILVALALRAFSGRSRLFIDSRALARRVFSPTISEKFPSPIDLDRGWHAASLSEKIQYLNRHFASSLGLPATELPDPLNCRELLADL